MSNNALSNVITAREYRVQGAYGRWFVEEYREYGGEWDSGTYGDRVDARSQKHANQIAYALNKAYRAGERDRWHRP